MGKRLIVCGIDVGNSKVKTVIAEIDRETFGPRLIGLGDAASNGMRRGTVVDMEEATKNIRDSVTKAENMAGVKISRAYASINGTHIRSQISRGIIAVSRADNEISQYDIDRVVDAASTISLPPNREIIHTIPRNFVIDAQEWVKNALGMKGVRLEADVLLIEGLSPYIRNLAKCLNTNDIEVAEFIFAPLATAKAVLNKHQKEQGVMNIDIGGGISSLAVFHEGDLIHTAVLPVGSKHITNDIAVAFRTSVDNAEQVKKNHGSVFSDDKSKKDQVDLSQLLGEEGFVVSKKQIAKIIDARISEIFDIVSSELKKNPSGNLLPAGVVLSGGGANLEGLLGFTKDRLRLFTQIGGEQFSSFAGDGLSDPAYATAIGLVIWGSEKEFSEGYSGSGAFSSRRLKKAVKWLKNFLP